MILLQTEHQTVVYNEELSLFEITLVCENETLTDEIFFHDLQLYLDLLRKYRPKYTLWDFMKFDFIISPEMQTKIDTEICAFESEIVHKQVNIMSAHFYGFLSVELIADEKHNSKIPTEFVRSREEGLQKFPFA